MKKNIVEVRKVADKIPYLSSLMPEIPANTIIKKVVTGLGATTSEIKARRNSIMIEPPRPVIEGKKKKHKDDNVFGVYEGVSTDDVRDYIEDSLNNGLYLKFMTTPESLPKVLKAIEQCGLNWRKDFFWLLDECQKFTTDVDYRKNITMAFRYFFEVEQKALVSATPLPVSDPRFEEQSFTEVEFQPDFDFSQPLKLITTNSLIAELSTFISSHADDERPICIFCNKTDLIYASMEQLDMKEESAIFCSDKSVKKLRTDVKFRQAYSTFDVALMRRLNWFTSRYYSACDIELDVKPHVVLLTDIFVADFTMFDPYVDTVQVVGRFRNGVSSLTHITNTNLSLHYYTPEQLKDYFVGARHSYETLTTLRCSEGNPTVREAYSEAIKVLPYNDYLNIDGSVNHFMVDFKLAEEAMRRLYTDPDLLRGAYEALPYFRVEHENTQYPLTDEFRLKVKRLGMSKKERQKMIVEWLDQLDVTEFDSRTLQELAEIDKFIVDAYRVLGRDEIEKLKYNQKKISKELAVRKHHAEATSPLVIKLITNHFEVGKWYPVTEIKEVISKIYKENGVKGLGAVTGTFINRYFDAEDKYGVVDDKKRRGYLLHRCFFATE